MASNRANRGYNSARNWNWNDSSNRYAYLGFRPVLVGYYVIRGYGFECVSLLYFKGEVILRLVSDGVKTVTNLRPALSYWEAGASLQCGYKPAS